jgi:hypothetical protein
VSIKVLFVFMVISSAALLGVAAAVFVRIWWQLKPPRHSEPAKPAESDGNSDR